MSFLAKTHQWIDYAADAAKHGIPTAIANDKKRVLEANGAINEIGAIGQAVLSPFAAAGGFKRGEFAKTIKDVYGGIGEKESLNYANIAGSAFTAGVGAGVLNGLTHDSAGNTDIAGIPMI